MKRRRLGQHYLVDVRVVRRMVEAASIKRDELVLEIGMGRGELTRELVKLGRSFEGYEVDRENYEATRARVGGKGKLHLGDAFEHRPRFDVLVASLPYSRSSDFVEWLGQLAYDRGVVLLQEDFVSKVLAAPGTKDYRAVSVIAQLSSDFEVLDRVSREAFSPPPKVVSVIVQVKPRMRISSAEVSRIKRLFSLRRRTVRSVLAKLGVDAREDYGSRRIFALSPSEVHMICAEPS